MRPLLTALLCALLWVGAAPAATVYKWLDEAGDVHYGSSPPPGADAEEITLRTPASREPPAEQAEGEAQRPGPEGAAEPPQQAAEEAQAGTEDPAAEDLREMRAINCRIARRNLETLQALPDQVLERDTEGGVVRLTPEEVAARLERARADVEKYCR